MAYLRPLGFRHARFSPMLAAMRAPVLAIALLAAAISSPAGTLTTPSYKITVEVLCPEGSVTCDDVRYIGVSRKSGKSINLTGRTVHTNGADGVTPSRFLGYEFKSGWTTYFVGENGELRVTRGSKILIQEIGVWK
jgi:hypothetical protein